MLWLDLHQCSSSHCLGTWVHEQGRHCYVAQVPLCLPHYRGLGTRHGAETDHAGGRQVRQGTDSRLASYNDHHRQATTISYRSDANDISTRKSNDPRAYCDSSTLRRLTVIPHPAHAISPSFHRHHVATTTRTRYADRVPGEGTHSLPPESGHSRQCDLKKRDTNPPSPCSSMPNKPGARPPRRKKQTATLRSRSRLSVTPTSRSENAGAD